MYSLKMESFDGSTLNVNVWDEVNNKVGAVLICHGMAEYAERYDDFAHFLNSKGYIVLAHDTRGHGQTASSLGVVDGDSFYQTVEDISFLVKYIKEAYKQQVTLIGHSYGSFCSQRYLELHASEINGCILSGTTYIKNPLTHLALGIASFQRACIGEERQAKLIDKLSFGSYNKPFASEGMPFAWLSRDKDQVRKYNNEPQCGFVMSIGFYYYFFRGIRDLYVDTSRIPANLPIMIAVGSSDPVSNKAKDAHKLNQFYLSRNLNSSLRVYPSARHEILNETNFQEVYQDFVDFISKT